MPLDSALVGSLATGVLALASQIIITARCYIACRGDKRVVTFVHLKLFCVASPMCPSPSCRPRESQMKVKMRHTPRRIDCGRQHPTSVERFQSYANTASQVIDIAHSLYKAGKVIVPIVAAAI